MSDIPYTAYRPRRRWYEDPRPLNYVVIEAKADGGDINRNALRALAAIVLDDRGTRIAAFNIVLQALEGRNSDPKVMALYREHPESWRINTADAQPPRMAMPAFAAWVKGLPGLPVVVAAPLAQSGLWVDAYLRRFTSHGLVRGPYAGEPLFAGGGLDLVTFVMGVTGRSYADSLIHRLPPEWRGDRMETHGARADAEMHADVMATMLRMRLHRRESGQ
jgi:hypothetical protein